MGSTLVGTAAGPPDINEFHLPQPILKMSHGV
jgi:hypothetical protein